MATRAPAAAYFAVDTPTGVREGVRLEGNAERGIVDNRAGEDIGSAWADFRPFPRNAVAGPAADRSGVAEARMLGRNCRREVHRLASDGHGEAEEEEEEGKEERIPTPKPVELRLTLVGHPTARGSSFSSGGSEKTIQAGA